MYVVDTTLSAGTRVTTECSLQKLVFPLPPDLQRKVRKDQRKYLCGLESAKGKNPTTGVETRDSLACLD